jgi:amidase
VSAARPSDPFGCYCADPFTPLAGAAGGSLHGLTFAVKDLIDTRGSITGAGNPDWRRTHAPAARHAAVIQTLLDAGARLTGRTITDELAFSLEGENHFYGTPVNPRCPERLPGGSSSGSAVAVAAGLVDFALGTDTGGSVRVPAAFCGIHGIRPTHGAVALDGVVPFAPSLDAVGWFARDAATLRRVGDVVLPASGAAPPIEHLLVAEDAFALADPAVADAQRAAIDRLPMRVSPIDASPVPMSEIARCYQVAQAADIVRTHGDWLRDAKPTFGPSIAPRFAGVFDHSAADIGTAARLRERLRSHLSGIFIAAPAAAAVVLPSAPCEPLARGQTGETIGLFYQRALAICGLASLAGLPQISIPLQSSSGLPVGLGIVSAAETDRALLDLAARLNCLSRPA